MEEDFARAVEDGLKLSKRLVLPGGAPPPRPPAAMDRSAAPDTASLLPAAPMVYAVVVDPGAVDSPDVPSYQPHVYGRLDPPALIPLQMREVDLRVDCAVGCAAAEVTVRARWWVHCLTRSRDCDCRIPDARPLYSPPPAPPVSTLPPFSTTPSAPPSAFSTSAAAPPSEPPTEALLLAPPRRCRSHLLLTGSASPAAYIASLHRFSTLPDLNEEFIMEDKDESPVDPCVERVLEGKDATDVRLAAMAVVAGSRGGLEKLAVRGSHPTRGVTDQGLLAVARGSPNLCSLALWDVPLVTDAGLAEIAAGCPSLERLDITRCPLITERALLLLRRGAPTWCL